ncbi:MAG: D-alanine--D-alanine ligase [Candidatus Pacebacteria bacterium]|nr:D-alanine--D-alanine ligase [Candidatus Paceibacterota bacterium]MBP9840466.1 D-alanine--D-alanine ligase [Candidatus Paceibacterota bacterium]
MQGTVVGVLRGGPSREHEVSLKSGAAMLAHLPADHYTVRDLYIDKRGVWHDRGREVEPMNALRSIDVALLGLHGEYGEDGQVQRLLENAGVPYAGSDSFSSHVAMHKAMTKHRAREAGFQLARDVYIESVDGVEAGVHDAIRAFHQPVVVKPVGWGSSVGVSIVAGYQPVHDVVVTLFEEGASGVLIEERIVGTEATVGVVENLRGEELYLLPAIEIVPPPRDFFSYDAKYSGSSNEVCPGRFSSDVSAELRRLAGEAHRILGLRHYSRSDFIVAPSGIYYLETNTLPGLTSESLMPKGLAAVGVSFPEFLHHLVGLAKHAV